VLTRSSLSTPLRRLIETMQRTNYGRIEGLTIRDGQPVFEPPPRLIRDVKLGAADNGPRPEIHASDFVLKREHIELFENLERVGDGIADCLEIKAGLPFRMAMEERI
jgi:hypothetical protein